MRGKAIGAVGGLLVFLAAAATAEAQINVTGTNPTCVKETDSQVLYMGTVINVTGCNFRLWVFQNGTQKFASTPEWKNGIAPFTVDEEVPDMNTWGLDAGQQIKFKAKVWTTPFVSSTHELFRTVEDVPPPPPSSYLPGQDRGTTPAGVRDELYAAILNDDEELLA